MSHLWNIMYGYSSIGYMRRRNRKVYSIQHYVITFCELCQVWLFYLGTAVSSTNKTDCHDIAEILLKVAFSTINPNPTSLGFYVSDILR